MPNPINVLVMVHGIVSDPQPSDPFGLYNLFYDKLVQAENNLPDVIKDRKIFIQWGHQTADAPPDQLRDDQKLTAAESFVHQRVSWDAVRADPSPNNVLLSGIIGTDYNLIPFLRNITTIVREDIVLFGLGDAVYYSAPDGEQRVRSAVYEQVLTKLEPYENEEAVRIHLIGHSLGVTLTHDFLYGLFATDHEPDFVKHKQGSDHAVNLFDKWRNKAQNGQLQLGTLISFASQLPVLIMRTQHLVDTLFNQELLDPAVIGILDQSTTHWLIFYDIDDVLGYATRRLYYSTPAIKDIQVDTGDWPDRAHHRYWENGTVIRETAKLILANSMEPAAVPT